MGAPKLRLLFLITSIIVVASIGLLNIPISEWNIDYLPKLSFLEGDSDLNRHTHSRYSRIAVIREGDLPFITKDTDETNDIVVSDSLGKQVIFTGGSNWDVPIFEEEMPIHNQF